MNKTSIEWTDYTWNPVTGCDKVSAGCRSCYAETLATRFWGERKFTDVMMHPERLNEPVEMGKKLHGKKVFVVDVGDLFHDDVTFSFIYDVFRIIHKCPHTVFQILTKRIERAKEFYLQYAEIREPLENVWLGVSCEDQKTADERIPILVQIPAVVRFLSCEPLIGSIDLQKYFDCNSCEGYGFRNDGDEDINDGFYDCVRCQGSGHSGEIHWVIVGGESGGKMARPMHSDWVRSIRDQCDESNVPFFFKQWGEWVDNSNMPREYLHMNNLKHHVFNANTVSATEVWKLGKSKSGNLLDGKQHLEFPKSQILNQQS